MPGNPLEPNPRRDAAIKARAHELWQADGAPASGAEAYLDQAASLVGMEESGPTGTQDVADLPDAALADRQIEDPRIPDNLGEVPARGADQGEQRHTPAATRDDARNLASDPVAEHGTPGQAHPDA